VAILAAIDEFLRGLRANGRAPVDGASFCFSNEVYNRSCRRRTGIREIVPVDLQKTRTIMRLRSLSREHQPAGSGQMRKGRKGSGVLWRRPMARARQVVHFWTDSASAALCGKQVATLCRSEFGDTVKVVFPKGLLNQL